MVTDWWGQERARLQRLARGRPAARRQGMVQTMAEQRAAGLAEELRPTAERLRPSGRPNAPTSASPRALHVVIEAGHGGGDPGAPHGGVNEADLNLALAREVEQLSGSGITYEVRVRPRRGGLRALGDQLSADPPDVVISLHHNAADDPRARRAEVWYHQDRTLSAGLAATISHVAPPSAPGLGGSGRWPVLKTWPVLRFGDPNWSYPLAMSGRYACVLVEAGFMTNPQDLQRAQTGEFRQQVAGELDQGIRAWAASNGLLGRSAPRICIPWPPRQRAGPGRGR